MAASKKLDQKQTPNKPNWDGKSILDKVLYDRAQQQALKEEFISDQEEWKKVVNGVCASPYGHLFMKTMIAYSGVFLDDNEINPANLIQMKGRKQFYLKVVRPYLDKTIKMEIENA